MDDSGPIGWKQVLAEELAALRPEGGGGLRALCISGGGIRSATFALGAIQSLAEAGLLQQFDYLSTVSGGGYIGGWLSAWMRRAGGMAAVVPELVPNAEVGAGQPDPVEHLRDYNNYLTPRLGALSADTWTLGATVSRNVMLNWLVFVPLMLAALMGPRIWLGLNIAGRQAPDWLVNALPTVAALLLIFSLWHVLRFLPGVGGVNHSTAEFAGKVLLPLVGSAVLFTGYESLHALDFWPTVGGILLPCVVAWMAYSVPVGVARRHGRQWYELLALGGGVLVLGAGAGVSAWLIQNQLANWAWPAYVSLGLPLLLTGFSLSGALFVGLSSHTLGTQDREWMARAAAYLSMTVVAWLVIFTAVLLAPGWVLGHPWKKWILAVVGVGSGWASSQIGYRSPSAAQTSAARANESGSGVGAMVLKVAPGLFLALLALGLALLTDWMLAASGAVAAVWSEHADLVTHTATWTALGWGVGFSGLGWFMARFININKFSLQGMYRDRLIRAYLGASNRKGDANRFTGFAMSDDIALHSLDARMRPLQVLNLTLNLVAGERLAWQQRKAESFTASALHCGSAALGYRGSRHYGGRGGMTLGTAVAISGAAASPNMGYHSSPLVGFIMTLFNVRLGAWLGNPGAAGEKTWTQAGPRAATRALLREALGQTTDQSDYVYLSDGGHFENLGLYEMVRRRCQTIVVLDGGCDPHYTYEDLGNALRKIRIDLKVPIKFSDAGELALRSRKERYAVAQILYSELDSACPDGVLIYVKPVLLGTEPPDVASYACAHPSFPHQSTAEQWFDESQTESYRMLGICTVADMTRGRSGRTLEDWAAGLAGGKEQPAGARA